MITFIERELTPEEIAIKDAGFDALGAEFGNPPEVHVRPCVVAMDGDRFVGYAVGRTNSSKRWYYLSDLYVEAAYRGHGLGTRLLAAAEAHARAQGSQRMWLWTAGFQAPGFYAKHGYTVFCEMDGWYVSGHARIGMWKDLPRYGSSSSSGTADGTS